MSDSVWNAFNKGHVPSLSGDSRSCTCHPDDNPPQPCPRQYAYSQCVAFAAGRQQAEAEIAELKARLAAVVAAWDKLSEGFHTPRVIGDWLLIEMKPVMDRARLASSQGATDPPRSAGTPADPAASSLS